MRMWFDVLLPVLVFAPMAGAVLSFAMGRGDARRAGRFAQAVCVVELLLSILLIGRAPVFSLEGFALIGRGLSPEPMQIALSALASLVWVFASILVPPYFANAKRTNRFYCFMLVTLGATQGVFLSGDLGTLFVFFEIMTFSSYALVKQEETEAALRAGQTYLALSLAAGMMTLLGLYLLNGMTGTLSYAELPRAVAGITDRSRLYIACALTAMGFAAKAGVFPLHFWLPDTHPAAPAPATILLSSILIKTGVFALFAVGARIFAGDEGWGLSMLCLGALTMAWGALLGVLSTDLKRTLACSSLSQVGFMIVGVGMLCLLGEHGGIAAAGVASHMLNHSLIKLILFGTAGIAYMGTHTLELSELRGWGRGKPFLMICFLIAALSLGGVPGFSGFASKTMLHEALIEYGALHSNLSLTWIVNVVEKAFIVTGGLTIAYMTKLFVALFVEKSARPAEKSRYMPRSLMVLFAVVSALIFAIGLFSDRTLDPLVKAAQSFALTHPQTATVFTPESVTNALYSIGIGLVAYALYRAFLMQKVSGARREYVDRTPKRLGLETLVFRPLIEKLLPTVGFALARVLDGIPNWGVAFFRKVVFNQEDDRRRAPVDDRFSVYQEKPDERGGFTDTLSFSFLLLGVGVAVALIVLLFYH